MQVSRLECEYFPGAYSLERFSEVLLTSKSVKLWHNSLGYFNKSFHVRPKVLLIN